MRELRQAVIEYLEQAKLMQVATSSANRPWVCSVWFTFDADLNLYWFSWTGRRHSRELESNGKVAGAIALPQNPEDMPKGLQFEGDATMLTNKEDIDFAIGIYSRIYSRHSVEERINSKERPHRFYMIKPTKYVMFDPSGFPDEPLQEMIM